MTSPNKEIVFLLLIILIVGGGYALLAQRAQGPVAPAKLEHSEDRRHDTTSAIKETASSQTAKDMEDVFPTEEGVTAEEPGTMEERVQVLETRVDQAAEQIAALSSEEVKNTLLEAIRSGDDVMLNVANNELIARGKKGDGAAIQAIQTALDEASPNLKAYLIGMLGEIATADSLQSLLEILDMPGQNGEARWEALKAVANIGKYRDQDIPPQALSSLLGEYFDAMPQQDLALLGAVADGLSTVGMPEGVEKILSFLEMKETDKTITPQLVEQMSDSLHQVRNPAAIAPLQARLQQDGEIEHETTRIAGDTLAAMGNAQATGSLLQWASGISGEAQMERALAWFSQVRDEQSLQLLLHVRDHFQFRELLMLEKITAIAKQIDRESTPETVR
jgi:hypothetical protein